MTAINNFEFPHDDNAISLKDIVSALKSIMSSLIQQLKYLFQLILKRKKLFFGTLALLVAIGAMNIYSAAQQYRYTQTIKLANYGDDIPIQDANTALLLAQNSITPELMAYTLKDSHLKTLWLNSKIRIFDYNDQSNDSTISKNKAQTYILIEGKGSNKDESAFKFILNQFLDQLQTHQAALIKKRKDFFTRQLILSETQLSSLNALVPKIQKEMALAKNSPQMHLPTPDSEITSAKMFGAVELTNILSAQNTLFNLQDKLMTMKFNLDTLEASHFSSKFGIVPLKMHRINQLLIFTLFSIFFALIIIRIAESRSKSKN